ncbi:MAG: pyridoxamine 5'-phosphate oxidase family protein [bacterium]|nr:pyridoxamine 5'-phosphate oxidase family protein [bacterium]
MESNQNQKFYEMLKEFDTAMLVTRLTDRLCARPMAIAKLEENCNISFLTSEFTEMVKEIEANPIVQVTCQRDHGSYLALSGMAKTSQDHAEIAKVWKPSYEVWFPKGINDPELCLISVTSTQGEYWDNRGVNKIKYLFNAVKAFATGSKPNISEGNQHGEVRL